MNAHKLTNTIKFDGFALFKLIPMLALIAFLTYASSFKMNGREYRFDGLENAVASYHLMATGTISLDGKHPSQFREPFPIALNALYLKFFTNINKKATGKNWLGTFQNGQRVSQMEINYPADYFESQKNRQQISEINLAYIFTSMLAIWWLTFLLSKSHWIASFAIVLSWLFFYFSAYFLYRPMTEYLASFLILVQTSFLILYLRRPSSIYAISSGISFGFLALTKASALYISIIAIPIILLVAFLYRRLSLKSCTKFLTLSFASITIVVSPWAIRNHQHFGSFSISERGGSVLLTRALTNSMTDSEFKNAFYVYAPLELKKISYLGIFLGSTTQAEI